ncbi:hypothetical protein CVT91_03545 [Candidatus Atribacteria bacterium HGW-Atribacteria-1]|nr:MAG: hypothetical protein CVT91_03545 [Candidatus Atribacteria bacterium HGW-Atribacteria-1]
MLEKLTADMVLLNGKIITVDGYFSIAQAVAIKDGKFLAVGSDTEIKPFIGKHTKVFNLSGKTVVPGFIDSHLHMKWTGLNLNKINLRGISSIEDIVKAIEKKVKEIPKGEWIQGFGWDEGWFKKKRYPNRWDLDKVSPDNPVHLERAYGHIEMVNGKALEIAGITKDTSQPSGGKILKNPETGEPTGVLSAQGALKLIQKVLPQPNHEEQKEAIKEISKKFSAAGITSVYDGWCYPEDLRVFQELKEAEDLTVRICGMVKIDAGVKPLKECLAEIQGWGPYTNFGDHMLKIGGIKIVLDGGIGGKTALSRLPYIDDPANFGIEVIPTIELMEICKLAAKNNWQVGVHCCGGKAIDLTLETYKRADAEKSIKNRRWMLIHAYEPDEHTFADCRKLGVVVAAQPVFIHLMGHSFLSGWGKERASCASPLRDWLNQKVHVGGGSDSPTATFEPLVGIWAAVNRRAELTGEKLWPEQCISVEEALRMFTVESAYLTFDENIKGSIEPGKFADLVVLGEDILHVPNMDIKDISILMTIMDGNIVYKNEAIFESSE